MQRWSRRRGPECIFNVFHISMESIINTYMKPGWLFDFQVWNCEDGENRAQDDIHASETNIMMRRGR